jgi:hypothetical protein
MVEISASLVRLSIGLVLLILLDNTIYTQLLHALLAERYERAARVDRRCCSSCVAPDAGCRGGHGTSGACKPGFPRPAISFKFARS